MVSFFKFFSAPCSPSCVEKIDHDLIQRECMGRSISQKSRTNENISNRGWTLGIKPYSMIEVRSRKESWMIREIFYWPSEEFPVLNLKVQKCRFGLGNLMKNIYKQKGFVWFFCYEIHYQQHISLNFTLVICSWCLLTLRIWTDISHNENA